MTKEYQPTAGEFIFNTAKNALEMSKESGRQVYFEFNTKKVYVNPWDNVARIIQRFHNERYN